MAPKRKLTERGEIRFYEWLENKISEEGSGRAFCERTGLSEGDLSKFRKGSRAPTLYMAEKFAAVYDITAEDIIGKDGAKPEDMKPRGDRTGAKRKPKERSEPQAEEVKQSWEMVLQDQIDTIDTDISKLEEEIRQLKVKRSHFEEILSIYHDWRAGHAD